MLKKILSYDLRDYLEDLQCEIFLNKTNHVLNITSFLPVLAMYGWWVELFNIMYRLLVIV